MISQPISSIPIHAARTVAGVLAEAAAAGVVRDDVPVEVLAAFCVSALNAAGAVDTAAAVETVVDLVWAGLQVVEASVG